MFELRASRVISYRNDLLSGLTVALALVPEAVAFAFVAGVDPLVGLYAAFMVGLITACIGGRPGMISGATGALAGYGVTGCRPRCPIPVYDCGADGLFANPRRSVQAR